MNEETYRVFKELAKGLVIIMAQQPRPGYRSIVKPVDFVFIDYISL